MSKALGLQPHLHRIMTMMVMIRRGTRGRGRRKGRGEG
jgi:hypothetical protein